jgi:serine/threonine-protein kinase
VIRGEAVTRQADIFAAGIVLWELVTGKKLFSGANEQERLLKILAGNYPAPSLANPDLPAALDRIVMRALHPDVASRYSTALEMAVELETYLPPVSQRIVSEWVQGLAADTLEARAELLQQVEVSHLNSVPASMSSLEVGEATRKVDSLESGSVRGGAKSVGAASIGWSKVAVAALFVTLAIVALFVRRPQPAPPPALASTLPAEAPPVASVGAAPLETVHPTPSSQDSTPTVARSPEASGSTKAAKRSRPPDRVPGSQRSDPARVPGTAHAQDFLPDQL